MICRARLQPSHAIRRKPRALTIAVFYKLGCGAMFCGCAKPKRRPFCVGCGAKEQKLAELGAVTLKTILIAQAAIG